MTKLVQDAGGACATYHDATARKVNASNVQCKEIWSLFYAKAKNVPTAKAAPEGAGDVCKWTAIERATKMILAFEVGDRFAATALECMDNLRVRLATRVQLATDGPEAYLEAVEGVIGGDVDYGILLKLHGDTSEQNGHKKKYSLAECSGARKELVSTSHIGRQNLTTCIGMRRFTRLTIGFSKKLENHLHMPSIYFVHYNFVQNTQEPANEARDGCLRVGHSERHSLAGRDRGGGKYQDRGAWVLKKKVISN